MSNQYPECEKWAAIKGDSGEFVRFIEWYRNRPPKPHQLETDEQIAYEYFGIDADKLEAERKQMLEELRNAN